MTTFEMCAKINDLLSGGRDGEARDSLIQLLDTLSNSQARYDPLVNHLIRSSGLFPYMEPDSAEWSDRFVYESFKTDIGAETPVTLHREQSAVLRRLLDGESLAISAPTSFGKSFIIDAYIALSRPRNVVVIVPTLALTDETRRRLQRKFGHEYKIITTSGAALADRNILVFPQERAPSYVPILKEVDLLVVDEFYKAGIDFDRDRAPSLLHAIARLTEISKQRYFLAPNISQLQESAFTKGMTFWRLDLNTVYLEKHLLYDQIGRDAVRKSATLLNILRSHPGKTLIYAGSYTNIARVGNLLRAERPLLEKPRLQECAAWLADNYDPNWDLPDLVQRGIGVHNGQLHRPLSQIQIRLFDEDEDFRVLISTSSIIEGVNTSAENVVVWSNKNGRPLLNDFTYRNIIGRGGRMFRHFVGKIFVLERPPEPAETALQLAVPDELLGVLDEEAYASDLTQDQVAAIIEYRREMSAALGPGILEELQDEGALAGSDSGLILRAAREIAENPQQWNALRGLNSEDPSYWEAALYRVIGLQRSGWDTRYSTLVAFVKVISRNWTETLPELLTSLDEYDVGIDDFFKLERVAAFKLAALLSDVNVLQRKIRGEKAPDISHFVAKLSHAFLPPIVYQLEEYGLPRMVSRKIANSGVVDMEAADADLHEVLAELIAARGKVESLPDLVSFEHYILDHFFSGLEVRRQVSRGAAGSNHGV